MGGGHVQDARGSVAGSWSEGVGRGKLIAECSRHL